MPAGLEWTAPAENATIDQKTIFRWSGPTGAIYAWLLFTGGGTYLILTSATEARIPVVDLPGFSFPANRSIGSRLLAFGAFDNIDAAAGPNGFFGLGDLFEADMPEKGFVAGP